MSRGLNEREPSAFESREDFVAANQPRPRANIESEWREERRQIVSCILYEEQADAEADDIHRPLCVNELFLRRHAKLRHVN